ncbi:MAG: 3-deoxy-manno-octulosonate cytidylyltransferase [Clostridiaceae bacterium]|jgi:3-deoxy-manno-octulosonate cytidylyltransferase (CMP-KDO synthetase)|nr:3-deoxy-manno-octulosonate cytidylyltransferase [Clostridiaceae bacterium]
MTYKVIGVIPARYGSTRLEGKPLKDICGKPMIQHVYERASEAKTIEKVIVATDDLRILEAVKAFGGEAVMTSVEHKTGTDRIAEVVRDIDTEIVVNIQGDEPLIIPGIIDEIVSELINDESVNTATGCCVIKEQNMLTDPNVVKVVFDRQGFALYFSRSLIPHPRKINQSDTYEHIGIYAYRKDYLMKYITLEDTPLSLAESLEQLKVLEHGDRIKVVSTKYPYNALSVDTQDDLDKVRGLMKEYLNRKDNGEG